MKLKKLLFTFIVLLIAAIGNPLSTLANSNPALYIATDNNKVLFFLTNLKPGDYATRKLTIQNRGEEDFTYISDAKFKGGSEELYNEFLLEVSDSKGLLYSGKMKDFNGFPPRMLKSLHEEDLNFSVEFPGNLGNEFQGKGFEVQIRFYIEELLDNPESGNPDSKPEEPGIPENPGNPDSNPEEPGTPKNPGDPDSNPVEPEMPEMPENPGNPSNPDSNPEDPETPIDSNNPNPEDPDNSETPSVPEVSNPQDPGSPDGNDTPKPQRPITPEALGSNPLEGQILPATATNIFNYIALGIILTAAGAITLKILERRRLLV